MNPETITAVQAALAPVAEKIGQGAEHGWEILVAGQFAEGIATLIIIGVMGVIFGGMTILSYRKIEAWDEDNVPRIFCFAASAVISLIFLLVACINGYEALIQIFAPEYAALKFLISLGGA